MLYVTNEDKPGFIGALGIAARQCAASTSPPSISAAARRAARRCCCVSVDEAVTRTQSLKDRAAAWREAGEAAEPSESGCESDRQHLVIRPLPDAARQASILPCTAFRDAGRALMTKARAICWMSGGPGCNAVRLDAAARLEQRCWCSCAWPRARRSVPSEFEAGLARTIDRRGRRCGALCRVRPHRRGLADPASTDRADRHESPRRRMGTTTPGSACPMRVRCCPGCDACGSSARMRTSRQMGCERCRSAPHRADRRSRRSSMSRVGAPRDGWRTAAARASFVLAPTLSATWLAALWAAAGRGPALFSEASWPYLLPEGDAMRMPARVGRRNALAYLPVIEAARAIGPARDRLCALRCSSGAMRRGLDGLSATRRG